MGHNNDQFGVIVERALTRIDHKFLLI